MIFYSGTVPTGLNTDRVEALINYGLKESMKIKPSETPLFFTDSNFYDYQRKVEVNKGFIPRFS